jgi:hypothetical protein
VAIAGLAPGGPHGVGRISRVELLGRPGPLRFTQDTNGLTVELPAEAPSPHAVAFRIHGAA